MAATMGLTSNMGNFSSVRRNLPTGSTSATPTSNVESLLQRATAANDVYLKQAGDLYSPYLKSGTQSLDEYTKLLLGGVSGLQQNDANYNAMQKEGENTVMANRAVSGMLRSGATADTLNKSTLDFSNQYYGNRLSQLLQGVTSVGQYGVNGTADSMQARGTGQTDLANALANIQIAREGMKSNENAAKLSAKASKDIAKNTGGLFGGGGFLGLGF